MIFENCFRLELTVWHKKISKTRTIYTGTWNLLHKFYLNLIIVTKSRLIFIVAGSTRLWLWILIGWINGFWGRGFEALAPSPLFEHCYKLRNVNNMIFYPGFMTKSQSKFNLADWGLKHFFPGVRENRIFRSQGENKFILRTNKNNPVFQFL